MIDKAEIKLMEIEQRLKRVSPNEVDGILKDILYIFDIK